MKRNRYRSAQMAKHGAATWTTREPENAEFLGCTSLRAYLATKVRVHSSAAGTDRFAYVANWAQNRQVFKHNLDAIQRTADALIDGIEESDADHRGLAVGAEPR